MIYILHVLLFLLTDSLIMESLFPGSSDLTQDINGQTNISVLYSNLEKPF